ncbi:MAG: transporter substrate-binding domain-containing protein [Hyphomicrobiales bacterium]|nr:transporter substrate-binding domain-containing protein [Hyphomicrobiales bacterium]
MVPLACFPARAADPAIPNFWGSKERLQKPDLSGIQRLRFLTTVDFPPFNFLDSDGQLTGFNIDLARAICAELGILDKCQVQALPFGELGKALDKGEGEAVIAGLAITQKSREEFVFSRPYLRFPARFIMPKATALSEPIYSKIAGLRIGVMAGSAHERMLRAYFPDAKPVTFTRQDWLYESLRDRKIDGAFGDGMRFSFWLAGTDSRGCCRFAGGPYLAPEYLGDGMAIAVTKDDFALAAAFDYALREITVKGKFAELYLRYFPVSFY